MHVEFYYIKKFIEQTFYVWEICVSMLVIKVETTIKYSLYILFISISVVLRTVLEPSTFEYFFLYMLERKKAGEIFNRKPFFSTYRT